MASIGIGYDPVFDYQVTLYILEALLAVPRGIWRRGRSGPIYLRIL